MPLFIPKSSTGSVALTKDKDRIVAYLLTPTGVKKLRETGVRNGQEFPFRALAGLIRSGEAHSPHVADAAGQEQFGFDRPEELGVSLPRCELTGVTSDVHLVVYGEGSGTVARLLGPEPRFVLQKVTQLSVPIAILNLGTVDQLETAQKVPTKSPGLAVLREWFREDYEDVWKKLQQANSRKQSELPLGSDGSELPLGEPMDSRVVRPN